MSKPKRQELPDSQFIVFVDGMDGDVYPDYAAMTLGVDHAFKNGANGVSIKKWPLQEESSKETE